MILEKSKGNLDCFIKDTLDDNFDIRNYKNTKGEKYTESYIVKFINKQFNKFYDLYRFCNKFVHYSEKASRLTLGAIYPNKISINIKVGNKERLKNVIQNCNDMIEVTKVLFKLITDLLSK